jgi:voltage-gated potassium channel
MNASASHWHRFKQRLLWVGVTIAGVLIVGATGNMVFAGYPPFEAFYMALTTITTIGYGELLPMSRVARIWNASYIIVGVSTVLITLGALTQSVVELELSGYFQKRRNRRMIDKFENHYIICGFGRVGRAAAAELDISAESFLIVDRSEEEVEKAMRLGYVAVAADCTRDETLRELGISRAAGLIAALATDADNLYLILTAKTLNPKIRVATRVSEEDSEPKLKRAGADVVFAPFVMTGHRLSQSLLRPHVNEFIDFTTGNAIGLDIRIEQIEVCPSSQLLGKSLRDSPIRSELGIIVLSIRRSNGDMVFNPPADCVMNVGDFLIVLGPPVQLRRLEQLLGARPQ